MAGLLEVALPSSDEEDDDYNPTKDLVEAKKREKEELLVRSSGAGVARPRLGGLAELPEVREERERKEREQRASEKTKGSGISDLVGQNQDEGWRDLSKRRKREVRVDEAWKRLKVGHNATEGPSGPGGTAPAGAKSTKVSEKQKNSFAAQAMQTVSAAAKLGFRISGRTKSAKKVVVTETRNFAGKNVEVETVVDAATKGGAKAVEKAKATEKKKGLDYVLHLLDSKRKLNIIDKSKLDWKAYKRENKQVQEELNQYSKGGDRYTEKQGFLKRAELREYEIERDARLASSARNRGRL